MRFIYGLVLISSNPVYDTMSPAPRMGIIALRKEGNDLRDTRR